MSKRDFSKIGALWMRRNRAGEPIFTGEISIDGAVLGIVIQPNNRKKPGSNQPDFLIYAADDERNQVEDQIANQTEPF